MSLRTKLYRAVAIVGGLAIAAVFGYRIALANAVAAPLQPAGFSGICYHTDPSDWHCPDSTARFSQMSAAYMAGATLTITDKSGATHTTTFPAGTDAIFLSSNAMRNFLVRHYDATNARKAAAVRAYIRAHGPPTKTR